MKGVIINGYYNEKRFETKNPEFAHMFNSKSDNKPKGIIVK